MHTLQNSIFRRMAFNSSRTTALFGWLILASGLTLGIHDAYAEDHYKLSQVIELALQSNPAVSIAKAQEEAAIATVTTARAYINPEFEVGAGPSRIRQGNQGTRNSWGVGISQPLEYSDVRQARRTLAESNVKVAEVGKYVTAIDLRARVKNAFYDVLQRQAEFKLAEGDKALLEQVRDRVKLRVEVGEAPRYELIKAETERLAAERDYQSAQVRINEGKAYLRGLTANSLPADYTLLGELPLSESMPSPEDLKVRVADHPVLRQLKAATEAAEAKLKLEERLRTPGLTLRAGVDQDPDLTTMRLGLAIPLPLWNKREGQIAEASAMIRQSEAVLSERETAFQRDLDSAYQRYLIASKQVAAFEQGLLSQSEAVLKTAEAAYRYGERGILEYLDAQRTFRIVRKDYINARYDYVSAMLEIERLVGADIMPVQ